MKILNVFFLIFVFLAALLASYFLVFKKSAHSNDRLIVGTSLDYPPYESVDTATGQPVGVDIDVVHALADRLQKKMVIKNMPFTTLIFGLLSGDVDLIVSGMSPTPKRARMVAFSKPYLQSKGLVVLTKASHFKPEKISDLHEKTVAVNTGYIADIEISKYPEIKAVRLDAPSDCFMALHIGAVDAFVTASVTVEDFLKKNKDSNDFAMMELPNTQEICVMAINKNDKKLLEEINSALQSMRDDGTLQQIQQKWNI